ncbi:HS12B-like protein [Mya arenaria]|uniref:HS12B-like protein n=1 Tax=Mya arenaria TaxID=6604 RepID=A0ABY7ESJ5_MYAAR|nr:heat shock 70 kDa protein 12B-like [Mya arenaria]WAR12948.1 HS12B-like protein [Mya arenaria]
MSEHLLVVGLDFGTTYSGYAFQFRHQYNPSEPTVICAPQAWSDGKTKVHSMKTPTCLLLNADKSINSFGFEAERRYIEICDEDQEDEYYFFRRFKMKLHNVTEINASTILETEDKKKQLPALEVFAKSIECLKMKLIEDLGKMQEILRPDKDIFYVLTVPAIWNENAKRFMRQAAKQAGIEMDKLEISLEPECASLFCQYLPVDRFTSGGGQAQCVLTAPGTVYMIVDLGGGTADITVHEKLSGGKLREVHHACGGPWGGTMVDSYFIQMLSTIVQPLTFAEFMKIHAGDYLDLMRDFELLKRKVSTKTEHPLTIKIPPTLNEVTLQWLKKSFKEALEDSEYSGRVYVTKDKLKITAPVAMQLFQQVADRLLPTLESCVEELKKKRLPPVSLILMVGGFSESLYIQEVVQDMFSRQGGIRVLVPEEAGLCVLKGAVVFGRKPESIDSRILRYTYGAEVTPPFDPALYDQAKRTKDGKRCANVFKAFMERGKELRHGEELKTIYHTTAPNQKSIALRIFAAEKDVKYTTDDGCNFVGTLTMKLNTPRPELQDLAVEYIFGGTEIKVVGTEVKTNHTCEATIRMNE